MHNKPDELNKQYLDLLLRIQALGSKENDRTNVGESIQLFDQYLKFNTEGKYAPILQCRTLGTKLAFLEFIWMMNGNTDSKWLEDQGVGIWKGNTTRQFLDSRGLHDLPEGSIGKSYGYQFRNFGGVDQLKKVYNSLLQHKDNPSRRHVISIYNVGELDQAPLEPCCFLYEFSVIGDKLHLYQHMRSTDVLFGSCYNLMFGAYLHKFMSEIVNIPTGYHTLHMTNAHIYTNQLGIIDKMIASEYGNDYTKPYIKLNKKLNNLEDFLNIEYGDFSVEDFTKGKCYGKVPMAV